MAEIQEQELLKKVALMRRCYIKGFGNKNFAVSLKATEYVEYMSNSERSAQAKNEAIFYFDTMSVAHAKLPFEELHPSPDFAPIFVTKDLLIDQNRKLQELFASSDDVQGRLDSLVHNGTAIWRVGELFREKFRGSLKELRAIPQYANYQFELIDIDGRRWRSWECL